MYFNKAQIKLTPNVSLRGKIPLINIWHFAQTPYFRSHRLFHNSFQNVEDPRSCERNDPCERVLIWEILMPHLCFIKEPREMKSVYIAGICLLPQLQLDRNAGIWTKTHFEVGQFIL